MSKVIDALGRIKALCQGYVKDSNDDWNPVRGDYNGGVFAGPFGTFYAVYLEAKSVTGGGEASNTISTSAVPAGYLYVLQNVVGWHTDATNRRVRLRVSDGSTAVNLNECETLALREPLRPYHAIILREGGYIELTIWSMASGRILNLNVYGYKVRL